ncbi:tellurium resistance protein TerC [Malaciobacter molluscorum]|uniref:tellurium resistance protein TerC n=1 Tax=Malaciobacter molluscorum TaxID=1032072 RepID=UPI00100C2F95|nr:tellurium resistance protein TerC [Malaciobacter molluscorum]RXJ96394.1 tellurium resistance protein TerC [Malaciobacter molluscorum]
MNKKLTNISGIFLLLSLILSIFYEFKFITSLFPSGIFALLSSIILFFKLNKSKKIFISIFTFLGVLFYMIAYYLDSSIDLTKMITSNQFLLSLLISVHFLRLISLSNIEKQDVLPIGKKAFFKTYLGLHLFGSVINLSVVLLVADNLYKKAKLTKEQLIVLTRAFSSDAYWSPFFVAFAAATTYAHNSNINYVILFGLLLSFLSFIYTYYELKYKQKYSLTNFVGFPLSTQTIWLPFLLLLLVSFSHYIFRDLKVIVLISFYCILVVFIFLSFKYNIKKSVKKIISHSKNKLPSMHSELILFLVAGLFGSAVSNLLLINNINLPFSTFDGVTASIILAIIIIVSFAGIHPIISISILGHWMNTMPINQTLMAVMFLFAWGISVGSSPISGLNLTLQARYEVKIKELFSINIFYAFLSYLFSSLCLVILSYFLSI